MYSRCVARSATVFPYVADSVFINQILGEDAAGIADFVLVAGESSRVQSDVIITFAYGDNIGFHASGAAYIGCREPDDFGHAPVKCRLAGVQDRTITALRSF